MNRLGILLAAAVGFAVAWLIFSVSGKAPAESRADTPASSASVQNGAVVLSVSVQARNGIETARLRPAVHTEQLQASAVVLSAQGVIEARQRYVTAAARLAQARAALNVSRLEYERLKSLSADQNVSVKAVQAAEGTFLSDQAGLRAAENAVSLTEAIVRQNWGAAVTSWIVDQSAAFERLARQEDLLIEMTPPAGTKPVAAREVPFQLPDGRIAAATFVSRYPLVSPQIQSASYLYVTPSRPDLAPGMSLAALLPVKTVRGVAIPESAVVWQHGSAWAYLEAAAGRFVRREVPTQIAVPGGWLATRNFLPGETVVVRGAQQLLAEEFRSRMQAGD